MKAIILIPSIPILRTIEDLAGVVDPRALRKTITGTYLQIPLTTCSKGGWSRKMRSTAIATARSEAQTRLPTPGRGL